jgi:hypothetical protein
MLGERITIIVTNNGNKSLMFAGSNFGIRIQNVETNKTYSLGTTSTVMRGLGSGETKVFEWNTKELNNVGVQLKPGNYI